MLDGARATPASSMTPSWSSCPITARCSETTGSISRARYFYEPAVHVPLIISCPGGLPAARGRGARRARRHRGHAAGCGGHPTLPRHAGPLPLAADLSRDVAPDPRGTRNDVYCEYYNAMPWHSGPQRRRRRWSGRSDTSSSSVPRRTARGALRPGSGSHRDPQSLGRRNSRAGEAPHAAAALRPDGLDGRPPAPSPLALVAATIFISRTRNGNSS